MNSRRRIVNGTAALVLALMGRVMGQPAAGREDAQAALW